MPTTLLVLRASLPSLPSSPPSPSPLPSHLLTDLAEVARARVDDEQKTEEEEEGQEAAMETHGSQVLRCAAVSVDDIVER